METSLGMKQFYLCPAVWAAAHEFHLPFPTACPSALGVPSQPHNHVSQLLAINLAGSVSLFRWFCFPD